MSADVIPFAQPGAQPIAKPHVHRDGYGRPIINTGELRADGKPRAYTCKGCDKSVPGIPYRRATTFIGVLEDRYRLERWKMRGVARGLAMREAFINGVAAAGDDDRKVDRFVDDALDAAGTSDAATEGTSLHELTEQLDRGEKPLIRPSVRPDVDAYLRGTAHMVKRDIETFVVHDALKVAGTFDRLVEVDGVRYIADIKTGSIDWGIPKIAQQLAMYANSLRYDVVTGERTPLEVDPNYGLVIHLPVGKATCELVWLDLTVGAIGNEIAKSVWEWRDQDMRAVRTTEPPALGSLIQIAGDVQSLHNLWADNAHRWNDTLTELARARRAQIEAGA